MAANWIDQLANFQDKPVNQGDLNQAIIAQNGLPAYLQAPIEQAPVQAAAPQPKISANHLKQLQSYIAPPDPTMSPQAGGMAALSKQALDDQAKQLSGLNQYIDDIAKKPRETNWAPLASFVDSLTGSKLAPVAQQMAPQTQDEKDKMLFGLRNQLAQGQARLSSDQLKSLHEQQQIEQYQRHQTEAERHNLAMENKSLHGSDAQMERANAMKGSQAIAAVKDIHNDIKGIRTQAINIDKGLDLLGDPSVSNKTLSEVAQDVAAALNPKGGSSDLKLRELMTPSLQAKISDAIGYATSNPDQPAPPDVVKFWRNMGYRIQKSLDGQMQARAKGKLVGLQTASKLNPMVYDAAKEAASLYDNGKWRMLEGKDMPGTLREGAAAAPFNKEAMDWAKANPTDPRAAAYLREHGG